MKRRSFLAVTAAVLTRAAIGERDIGAAAAAQPLQILQPLTDQRYGGIVEIQARTDGISDLHYRIDVGAPEPMSYDSSRAIWRADWDTGLVAAGQYNVTILGRGQDGTEITDRAWRVRVTAIGQQPTNPALTVRIESPLSGEQWDGTIAVRALATVAAVVTFRIDDGAEQPMTTQSGEWQGTFETGTVRPGEHNVTVTAKGIGGGTVSDRAWRVKFNNASAPMPPIVVPPPVAAAPVVTAYLRGVNLAGGEFGDALPGVYGVDYIYPTATELDYYRGQGLTLIRLPFRWERLQRSVYGALDQAELARLDTVTAAARDRGMLLILEPHNYARYKGQLVGDGVPNTAFTDFWRRVAAHFRDDHAVWAYGLMNEPHDTDGRWPAAAQAGVDGIRSVDTSHTILVPGDGWSGAAAWLTNNSNLHINDPAENFLYEAHVYFDADSSGTYRQSYSREGAYPTVGADRLKPFATWLQERGVRGFLGEYGIPGDDPRWLVVLDEFLTAADAAGIGGTYWAGGAWWGNYALALDPQEGQERPQLAVLRRHPSR